MPLDLGSSIPDDAVMELKRALRGLMDATGTRQEAIEAATGIDQGRVSRITNVNQAARPTLADVLKIEAACGAKPGYVLGAAGLTSVEGTRAGARARSAGARRGSARSS